MVVVLFITLLKLELELQDKLLFEEEEESSAKFFKFVFEFVKRLIVEESQNRL